MLQKALSVLPDDVWYAISKPTEQMREMRLDQDTL